MDLLNRLLAGFEEGLRRANPRATQHDLKQATLELDQRIRAEPPPRIAVVGESGVGKSTTLNALFNAGLPISNTRACTKTDIELTIDLSQPGDRWPRTLVVYDMPGLGESVRADKENIVFYQRVVPTVDVLVWIHDAQDRALRSVQERLMGELSQIEGALEKLVFALNKVDLVHPGADGWNATFNVPGPEQQANIEGREQDVSEKIREAVPTWSGVPVGYSAIRNYRLSTLFRAMIDAVPADRRWLLGDRMQLASFEALVDQRVLRAVRSQEQPG